MRRNVAAEPNAFERVVNEVERAGLPVVSTQAPGFSEDGEIMVREADRLHIQVCGDSAAQCGWGYAVVRQVGRTKRVVLEFRHCDTLQQAITQTQQLLRRQA